MNNKVLLYVVLGVAVLAAAAYFFILAPGSAESQGPELMYYKPGDFIVTNISESARLMKITPILEYDNSMTANVNKEDYLKSHESIIRDTIIFIVRAKTEPELRSSEIASVLRNEISDALKAKLDVPYLRYVYFYDFVLQ